MKPVMFVYGDRLTGAKVGPLLTGIRFLFLPITSGSLLVKQDASGTKCQCILYFRGERTT